MKRRLSVTNLSLENNLRTFRLNAAVVIRAKVKRCEQTLLFIACTTEDTCHWRSKVGEETADTSSRDEGQEEERGPLVVIPYVVGMSEDIRRVCRKFNIRVVFKSGRTLHSMLTKVEDT